MNKEYITKMRIPIISLWNPWALWVLKEWKKIETRTHNRFACLNGKTIAIHSTVKWDKNALNEAKNYLTPLQVQKTKEFLKIGGAIIGLADVIDYRELDTDDSDKALINCANVKRFGLFLENVRTIPMIPISGKQGIWYLKISGY